MVRGGGLGCWSWGDTVGGRVCTWFIGGCLGSMVLGAIGGEVGTGEEATGSTELAGGICKN